MECDRIQKELSAYIEDALPSGEKGIIDEHLKSCPECRKTLADLEMTIRSLKGLEEITPPPWLTQKIMARVKAEAELTKRNFWQKLFYPLHVKLPLEAFGLFLIALTALFVFKSMEPKVNTVTAPSESTVSEYAAKAPQETEAGKPFQAPVVTPAKKKDETAGPPPQQESSPLPAQPPEQPAEKPLVDHGPRGEEKLPGALKPAERDMLIKSAPAPAALSAQRAASQESAAQGAGKAMSGVPETEDVSISLRTGDIDYAKKDIKEVLSKLGGRVIREEPASGTFIITAELGPDKLPLFMDRLKTLGSVKEKTLRPTAGKDQLLIKIVLSNQ
jgi:hypothetical protein